MGKLLAFDFPKSYSKKGWPWDIEVTEKIYEGHTQWPKMTIITPSFNQNTYIEESIRSVVLQNYPNLEFIIIDGGSTDNSIEIIKRYEKYISYWRSEKDFGQSHAINKGIYQSNGEIINWINSDDLLYPNSLFRIAQRYIECKSDRVVLVGNGYEIDENSDIQNKFFVEDELPKNDNYYLNIKGTPIQQSIFFSRKILIEAGGINPLLKYPMDIDLYNRMGFLKPTIIIIDDFIGGFRKHNDSKTMSQSFKMMEEKVHLLHFLSFYNAAKHYYQNQIVSYIVGASFAGVSFRNRIKYIVKALIIMRFRRVNFYKYRILLNKLFVKY